MQRLPLEERGAPVSYRGSTAQGSSVGKGVPAISDYEKQQGFCPMECDKRLLKPRHQHKGPTQTHLLTSTHSGSGREIGAREAQEAYRETLTYVASV